MDDKRLYLNSNTNLTREKVVVKIADFGFSKMYDPQEVWMRTQCGTPLNMAPEVLNGEIYNFKADIWSLGVIMF